jgi:peptidoglycan/xylan/chitin deacetylase (PgdA/CDA1 family)
VRDRSKEFIMEKLISFLAYDFCATPLENWVREMFYRSYSWVSSHPWALWLLVLTRYAKAAAAATAVIALVLLVAALITPPPAYFVLDKEHRGISTPLHPAWHQFSNWINHRKYVVLTFDDGPMGTDMDEKFLAILRRHHAHALFFLVCNKIDANTIPMVREMESEGHMIGNHSLDHAHVNELPYSEALHQIDACSSQIADVTGHRPLYFRPPFGRSSPDVIRAASAAGVQQVFWNASSYDYWYGEPEKIAQFSTQEASDMSILIMHERKGTAAALDLILSRLESRGFTFVLPGTQLQK